jgi:hypothetical protein
MEELTNAEGAIMKECIYKKEDMHLYTLPDVKYPEDK